MKVKITLTEEMLGTASANPEIHEEFIASKSKDAEKVKEELESLPAEELMSKATTVFHKDKNGCPVIWDYQIKGFVKEAIGVLLEIQDKEIRVGKTKLSKYTHTRIVDNYIFVQPRQIKLCDKVGAICTRPIRVNTMKGERVSLASSETVPAGTSFECEITTLAPALEGMLTDALNYGALKGLGQWRNSSKGRFTWEKIG